MRGYQLIIKSLLQMKSYAKEPYQKEESDRGILLNSRGIIGHIPLDNETCILAIFMIINLLLLTLTAFYLKSAIQLTERVYSKTVIEKYYWSTVVVSGLLNSVWFTYNTFFGNYNRINEYAHVIMPWPIILVLFIVVPIIAGLATGHITTPVPGIFEKICCCCVFWCCSKKCMSRSIHTLSLCHILWFLHRLISTSIVVICHFVIAPAQVLAVVSLFFSSVICIIVFSSLIFSSCACSCKCFVRYIGLVLLLLQILAIIVFFTFFYIHLTDNGLESDGIGGIFLSLIPPATFFIVGLIVERRLFNKARNSSGNEDLDRNDSQESSSQVDESSIGMMERGGAQSTNHPSVRQHIDENTHLLP